HRGWATHVAFSPDGKHLTSVMDPEGWSGSRVFVWDVQRVQPVLASGWHGGPVADVAFSSDGTYLAVASNGKNDPDQTGHVTVRDALSGEAKFRLHLSQTRLSRVAFSADDQKLLALGSSQVKDRPSGLTVWDIGTRQIVGTFEGEASDLVAR